MRPKVIPQLPLALRYPPDQRLESFIAAPAGAIAQLQALAQRRRADWLYLAGASATGKTHLALALCAAAEQAGLRPAYLPLLAASGRLRDALDALEGNDVVALDGLEAIAGNRDDEIALFDFHNRARSAGLNVLYTAQEVPGSLSLSLPDLRSRLSQNTCIVLNQLDDAARAELLRDRARRRGLLLEETAIDWMLARTDRSLASLLALLDRLDRESLAAQRRITVPFLRQVVDSSH
ncbi:MAG: DnaA regulatory inactivator Hda [Pseudoxanthomonas sp.]